MQRTNITTVKFHQFTINLATLEKQQLERGILVGKGLVVQNETHRERERERQRERERYFGIFTIG
jgi:hypothetical protein